VKSGVLKGVQSGPHHFSEIIVGVIWANELALIGKGVVLSSLLYLILNEADVLVS
jgi:hypothetical protein